MFTCAAAFLVIKSICCIRMFKLGLTMCYTVYKEQNVSGKVAITSMLFLFPVDLMLSKIHPSLFNVAFYT